MMHFEKKVRPKIRKQLSSGQAVEYTPQDERMLLTAYNYMQGYSKRRTYEEKMGVLRTKLQTEGIQQSVLSKAAKEQLELQELEEKYSQWLRADHKISLEDVYTLMLELGVSQSAEAVRHMIYEVDELVDEMISWDEFVLAYHRNVSDTSGSEPNNFFRIMEFVLFDPHHKGRIVEDDVMEVLFARIGAARLEEELQSIFGDSRRANGGDGTISLQQYLNACLAKDGRRALVY